MGGQRNDDQGCRILMYSHDTFGLGHLTRTLRIASAIQDRYESTSILVLTGSPVAPYLPLPARTDMVKLPTVLKMGADHYESRDLEIDFHRLRAMRREVIRGTAETFRPHFFMVDNVPLGMKEEIVPTLELLKRHGTKIVLNLRDILDDAETIKSSWEKKNVLGALEQFYDAIYVLGDRSIYDPIVEYGLPADRTRFVGYATPGPRVEPVDLSHPGSKNPARNGVAAATGAERPLRRVLVTVGGGGDGHAMLTATLKGAARLGDPSLEFEVVTGPLMDAGERRSLLQQANGSAVRIHEFVGDLPSRMAAADLVVAMAGYNTCCEVLSHARSVLLYPRITPRLEQKIRADAFVERGLATSMASGDPDPEAFALAMRAALDDGLSLATAELPRLEGQHRIARDLARLLPGLLEAQGRQPRPADSADDSWASFMRTIPEMPRSLAGLREALVPDLSTPSPVSFWPDSVLRT